MVNVFRWVCLCLFFLNISYFSWNMLIRDDGSHAKAASKQAMAVADSGKKIMLLSELPGGKVAVLPESEGEVEAGLASDGLNEGLEAAAVEAQASASFESGAVDQEFSDQFCPSLGPIADKGELKKVRLKLRERGLKASPRLVVSEKNDLFRVYLPPYEDRVAAVGVLKKLRAKKIDSYIITDDDLNNAISLGLFAQQDSANALVDKLNSYGYPAETKVIAFIKEAYWLEVSPSKDAESVDKILVSLMSEIEGVTRIDSPCKVIALNQ